LHGTFECQVVGIVLADLLVRRGLELEAGGHLDDAKHVFRTALRQAPSHPDAINGLGRVLYREGSRRAARVLFERLVARHPADAAGHANLGIVLLEADDFSGARTHLERALALDTTQSLAHVGLSRIAAIEGNDAAALAHQRAALGTAHEPENARAGIRAPRLLLLSSEQQLGAVAAQRLTDSALSLATLVVERAVETPLPPHHAIWNTITDADRNAAALEIAARIAATTGSPLINDPNAVLATSRTQLPHRLRGVEDAVLPLVRLLPRAQMKKAGVGWPLLVRAPGYHSGQHFALVDDLEALRLAAAAMPGDDLLFIEYVDTRSADGLYRKYRVMIVDGKLYPLHLAVSETWKVHYFSAGMAEHPERRAEEASFLESMETSLGGRAVAALERIAQCLALDYAGIDFALDREGRVVVFEANATMTVPSPPSDARWDYRRIHVNRILSATRRMLFNRARAGGWR
jgi:hypothetical protein